MLEQQGLFKKVDSDLFDPVSRPEVANTEAFFDKMAELEAKNWKFKHVMDHISQAPGGSQCMLGDMVVFFYEVRFSAFVCCLFLQDRRIISLWVSADFWGNYSFSTIECMISPHTAVLLLELNVGRSE